MALLLAISSQVPGLHQSSGRKKKTRADSASRTRPSPAQRIAAQLASRIPNLPITVSQHQSPPPHEEDHSQYEIVPPNNLNKPAEEDETNWSEFFNDIIEPFEVDAGNSDSSSSTEPASDDEDEHRQWGKRNQMREQRQQQKDHMMATEDNGLEYVEDAHGQWHEMENGHHSKDRAGEGGQHSKHGKPGDEHRLKRTEVHKQGRPEVYFNRLRWEEY
jgi:hypothetical protein